MKEENLKGGRSTIGVVKIKNTVRRPHKGTSDFSNKLLRYLENNNYSYSQKYLGLDEEGRDIFEFIEGFVPNEIGETTLNQLCQFMNIVKSLHDISTGFTNSEKVVCHNDLSPCNVVFCNKKPIAIIDWDSAAFGERWEDITYILWLWINIGSLKRKEINIIEQIKISLSAYGADDSIKNCFADKLILRMDRVINEMSPNNYQYNRTKDWVEFSKLWVEDNRNIITKEIG